MLADVESRERPTLVPFHTVALSLPGCDRKLDFSGFWHIPHRLKRWVRTRLASQTEGTKPFVLTTCGGVHVWVDGIFIAKFEPYTRNCAQQFQLDLPLQAGGSDVVILLEDMAERDTHFFLELKWCGSESLDIEIPTTASPDSLQALMNVARGVRPAKVVFDGFEPVNLVLDRPAEQAMTLKAQVRQSVHLSHLPPLFSARVEIAKGDREISLMHTEDLPDAYHPLDLTFEVGEARVSRQIAFAMLRQPNARQFSTELSARKAEALAHACKAGEPRMGRVLALLGAGQDLDADARMAFADTLRGIVERRDCSDFVMLPLLWAMGAYCDQIPIDLQNQAEAAILGYRYWMDEPGNDTMWFWSENHVLCFHASQYLAGRLYPDAVFSNSGRRGAEMIALGAQRMARWYDSVEASGFAEWNSAAYYPIDFIGLLTMHHWAEGPMKERATRLLDQLFTMIGLNSGVACVPQFCLTDYEPPAAACGYAAPGKPLEARYVQGHGAAARLALHKTAHVQLSAVVDGKLGETGHQQHLIDVQFAARPFARVWLNHPGDDDPWSEKRPSFWAGNGVMPRVGMAGRRALFLSDLPADATLPFTHAYAPLDQFESIQRGFDWMVLQSGGGAVILKATGSIETTSKGAGAGIEHKVEGHRTGWVIITCCGDTQTELVQRAAGLSLTWQGATLSLEDPKNPLMTLDPVSGLLLDGQPVPFPTSQTLPQVTRTDAPTGKSKIGS